MYYDKLLMVEIPNIIYGGYYSMRKLGKFLVALVSMCVLVGTFALVISANEADATGTFVVDGEVCDTWDKAVEKAVETGAAIVLGGNFTITEDDVAANPLAKTDYGQINGASGVTQTAKELPVAFNLANGEKIRVDLNGKTITQEFDGTLFNVTNGALTVYGSATVKGARTVFNTSGENASITVKAGGNGIDIYTATVESTGVGAPFAVFSNTSGSSASYSGDINVYPVVEGMLVFRTARTENDENAAKLVFDNARVILHAPSGVDTSSENYSVHYNVFMYIRGDSDIIIKNNSHLEVSFGILFSMTGSEKTAAQNRLTIKGYLNAIPVLADGKKEEDLLELNFASFSETREYETILDVDNSTLISNDKHYVVSGDNYTQGQIAHIGRARILATFDNCRIKGGNIAFRGQDSISDNMSVSEGVVTHVAAPNQFIFNDCEYIEFSTMNTRNTFENGVNAQWNRCTISARGSFSMRNYLYHKLGNGFIGILLNDTFTINVNASRPAFTESTDYSKLESWNYYFSNTGNITTDARYILSDGTMSTNATFYGTALPKINSLTDFSGNLSRATNVPASALSTVTDPESGNVYKKVSYTDAGGNYTHIRFGTGESFSFSNDPQNAKSAIVSSNSDMIFNSASYIISEFDISTDTQYPAAGVVIALQGRNIKHVYNADGTLSYDWYKAQTAAWQYTTYYPSHNITLKNNTVSVLGSSKTLPLDMSAGVWHRISLVYEIKRSAEPVTRTVSGASVYDGSALTTASITADFWDYGESLVHVYVDGTYIDSVKFVSDSYRYIHVNADNSLFAIEQRMNLTTTAGDSICIDNNYSAKIASGIKVDDVKTLINNMPDDNLYIGRVDGIGYGSAETLTAAIKDGSTVSLNKDFLTLLPGDEGSYTVFTNGHTITGFNAGLYKMYAANEVFEITETTAKDLDILPTKFNLTLYSNMRLNFYIPKSIENTAVTNIKFATTADGTVTGMSNWSDVTIYGEAHKRYAIFLDTTDLTSYTFYVIYKLNGVQLGYPVYCSIPQYVDTVMSMSVAKDPENPAPNEFKSEAAEIMGKKLIMNMVNYVDKLIKALGGETLTNYNNDSIRGAKLYRDLLADQNNAKYLEDYTKLNPSFFTSGSVYTEYVEPYILDENDKKFVDKVTIYFNSSEPQLIFRFNDDAAEKYGVAQPVNNALNIGWNAENGPMWTSFSWNGSSAFPAHHYATLNNSSSALAWNASNWKDYEYNDYYCVSENNYKYDPEYFNDNWGGKSYRMSDIAGVAKLDISYKANASDTDAAKYSVEYTLAAYIYSLVKEGSTATDEQIELAYALYSYANISNAYIGY